MSTQDTLHAFAALLAEADDQQRQSLLKRVNLMAMNQADPEAFEPPILTARDYLARPIEIPPILVEPRMMVRGALTCTIGRAGKGKTVMNLNRLIRWAAGLPWFDTLRDGDGNLVYAPVEPLRILVIENEGAAGLFHQQLGLMLHCDKYLAKSEREVALDNLLIWGDGGYSGLKLDDPRKLDEVRSGCEKFNPDLVFIEPFRGLWKGDENSSTEMGVVADALVELATDYGCGVLMAHHERKSGAGDDGEKMSAGRGSTVLEGVVAIMENFESVRDGDFRELSTSKSRYGRAPSPTRLEWDHDAWWYRHVPLDEIDQNIMRELEDSPEPMTVRDLCEATEEKDHTIRKHLKGLVEAKRVKRLPSEFGSGGSTGNRYRPYRDADDVDNGGGLGF